MCAVTSFLPPETIERLEALRRTTAPPAGTVPLYKFAESA